MWYFLFLFAKITGFTSCFLASKVWRERKMIMENKLKILLMLVGVFFLFQIDVKANKKIDTRLTVRFQLVEQDTSTDEEEQIALAGMEFAVYTEDGKLESILYLLIPRDGQF